MARTRTDVLTRVQTPAETDWSRISAAFPCGCRAEFDRIRPGRRSYHFRYRSRPIVACGVFSHWTVAGFRQNRRPSNGVQKSFTNKTRAPAPRRPPCSPNRARDSGPGRVGSEIAPGRVRIVCCDEAHRPFTRRQWDPGGLRFFLCGNRKCTRTNLPPKKKRNSVGKSAEIQTRTSVRREWEWKIVEKFNDRVNSMQLRCFENALIYSINFL